jgi:hypothetical protein
MHVSLGVIRLNRLVLIHVRSSSHYSPSIVEQSVFNTIIRRRSRIFGTHDVGKFWTIFSIGMLPWSNCSHSAPVTLVDWFLQSFTKSKHVGAYRVPRLGGYRHITQVKLEAS